MKNVTLKIPIIFSIIIILLGSITFVYFQKPNSINTKTNSENKQNTNESNTDIENFFPIVEGKVLNYSGVAEYSENLTVNKIIKEKNKKTIVLKGQIVSLQDETNNKNINKNLEYTYEIYGDGVRVTIINANRKFSQSIIDSQFALRTPIKAGNSWSEKVYINGKTHKCNSMILSVSKDTDGKSMVKIQHTVGNMPNYPNNIYKEVKTYKEGLGLYQYESTILLPNTEDKSKPIPFDFKYKIFEDK